MDHLAQTDDIFFTGTNLEQDKAQQIVRQALAGADDGELFLEMRHSEMLAFDDGRLKSASYDQSSGFGLRAIAGEAHGYAHAGELSEAALRRGRLRAQLRVYLCLFGSVARLLRTRVSRPCSRLAPSLVARRVPFGPR